tara:strand:+ start:8247 stop:9392 length:1146 start_codon:yes stop_codon:yes gene_type:complete
MKNYQRVKAEIKKNKKIREDGGYTCIPFVLLPKLGKVIPGIEQEKYYLVTANSKVGKTKLGDFLFVYNPYEFITKHASDISLKIFYFSLEVSKEEKIAQYYSYRLFKDHGVIISPAKLKSRFQDYILETDLEELLDSYDEEMDRFESIVHIIDNIKNPFGIYKYMRDYAYKNGTHYDKNNDPISVDRLLNTSQPIKDEANKSIVKYIPNNPNEYVIVITDHLSLLHPEGSATLWDAIFTFSSKYCLAMRDRWRYIPVNIQQQAADQEKQQFTFKGDSIIAKLRPSPDGLADCKLTQRDVNVMLGLFNPHRYKISDYEGYDIDKLGDNYREFNVMLNRDGSGFINIDLYFNGASNFFKELPSSDKIQEKDYKAIAELNAKAK